MTIRPLTIVLFGLLAAFGLSATGCANAAQREAKLEASAKSYLGQQRYSEAIIQYRNAIALSPHSAALEYALGQAYSSNQQFQDAFAAFTRALQIQPDYAPAQLAVGEYYLVAKQYPQALASTQLLLRDHPGDAGAEILLANIDAAQGMSEPALQRLEALVKAHGDNLPAHLALGMLYAAAKRYDDAQQQFQRATRLDPHSVLARNDLASLLGAENDWVGAEAVYRADIAENPDSIPARQALADFLLDRHRYAEAEPIYKQLVTLRHNSPQARFALASFYLAQGNTGAAVAMDRVLARQAPNFLQAREQWAQIAARNQDYAQANQVLDTLLKDQPDDMTALLLRAGIQLDQHQPTQALATLAAAQRLNPNLARVAFDEGQAYLQQNNPDRAQDYYLQAVALDPQFFDAQSALAELLLDRGHSDSALNYANKMQTIAPDRPEGYFFAGNALANLHQWPQAESAYLRFIALAPESSLGPGHLGYLYLMERRFSAAERQFEQALKLNPADTDALAGLVTLYQSDGRGAKAIPRIQAQLVAAAAARATPPMLAAMNDQLAKAWAQQKRFPEAEGALNRALAQDPHNYSSHALLGTLYAQQNSLARAQAQFSQAVAANPNSAGLWTQLGMLDEQTQKPGEAEQAYQRALAIDPDNGVANNNLAALYSSRPQDLDQALVLAQRAKRALPGVANVSDTLGWIYVNKNVYQLAIPLLQQAVRGQPDSSGFRVHLATALYRDGRKPEAQAELNQAIRLDKRLAQQPEIQQMLKN